MSWKKEIIFQKKKSFFHMFSYLTLASGALFLVIIVIADNSPWNCVTDVIYNFYHVFPNAYNIKMYRHIDRK